MNKRQTGFTLIELVVVILILGLLAAVAFPRYAALSTQARISSINGVAGGLRGAVALVRAQYLVNNNTAATTVTMLDGTVVTTSAGVNGGIPISTAAGGIDNAMLTPTGYTFTVGATATFVLTGVANCQVNYTGATGLIVVDPSGC